MSQGVLTNNWHLLLVYIIMSLCMAITPTLSQPVCTGENGSPPLLETAFSAHLPYQVHSLHWFPDNRVLVSGGGPGPLIVDIDKKTMTPVHGLTDVDDRAAKLIYGTNTALSRDGRYAASYLLHLDETIVYDLERSSLVSRRRHWPLYGSLEGRALKFHPGSIAFDKIADWLWVADLSTQHGQLRRFAMRVGFREPFSIQPVSVDLGDNVTNSDSLTTSILYTKEGALLVSLLRIGTSPNAGRESELLLIVSDLTTDLDGKATNVRTIKFKSNLVFDDVSVSNNVYVDWERAYIFIVGPGAKGGNADFITEVLDFKTGNVMQTPFSQDYKSFTVRGLPIYTFLTDFLLKPFRKTMDQRIGGVAVLRASGLAVLTLCAAGKIDSRVLSPNGKYLATGISYFGPGTPYHNRLDVFRFIDRDR